MFKKKKRTISVFKAISAWLHLWLGLVSGIIVFIVSITGCLFVFQQEVSDFKYRSFIHIQPQQTAPLSISVLQRNAQAALGKQQHINFITAYKDNNRAWEFMAYKFNDTALTYFGNVEYYRSAYVNPYTGIITGIKNYKYDFFTIVKYLHWSLLLKTSVGQPIVGYSTLIFVLLLLTGLVLWWPKKWNASTKQQAFKIKWKASFKRVNYDLHNVPGFYTIIPSVVLGVTGLVFSFSWVSSLVYVLATGSATQAVQPTFQSAPVAVTHGLQPLDVAYNTALQQLPNAKRIGISPPGSKDGVVYIYGYNLDDVYYNSDQLLFDQYSGKLLYRRNNTDKNSGEKLLEMNYDIHVGAIGGIAGKIIAFVVSLICASLPVTGFLVWWGKHKKKPISKTPV